MGPIGDCNDNALIESVVVTDADQVARHAPLDDARRTRRREKESLTSLSGDYGLVVSAGNERWSSYGAQRAQPVAIGGKWNARESGSKRRKPLPWVATSCLRRSMVRRGSPVRVRKRASSFCLLGPCFRCLRWRRSPTSASTERPPASTVDAVRQRAGTRKEGDGIPCRPGARRAPASPRRARAPRLLSLLTPFPRACRRRSKSRHR
jgi:hypothetical protein